MRGFLIGLIFGAGILFGAFYYLDLVRLPSTADKSKDPTVVLDKSKTGNEANSKTKANSDIRQITMAPYPIETSGVASLGDGAYAVIGEFEPGPAESINFEAKKKYSGITHNAAIASKPENTWANVWQNNTLIDSRDFNYKKSEKGQPYDFESLDIVSYENQTHWFLLSEGQGELVQFVDPLYRSGEKWNKAPANRYRFSDLSADGCNRGLEGLAVEAVGEEFRIAVLWEGGAPRKKDIQNVTCTVPQGTTEEAFISKPSHPRVATFMWSPTRGLDQKTFKIHDLDAQALLSALPGGNDGQFFRAPDLVWHGDSLLVMLSSHGKGQDPPFKHLWLQAFCPSNDQAGSGGVRRATGVGAPLKLRIKWPDHFKGLNYEGLDWEWASDDELVLAFDDDAPIGRVVSIDYEQSDNKSCSVGWFASTNGE